MLLLPGVLVSVFLLLCAAPVCGAQSKGGTVILERHTPPPAAGTDSPATDEPTSADQKDATPANAAGTPAPATAPAPEQIIREVRADEAAANAVPGGARSDVRITRQDLELHLQLPAGAAVLRARMRLENDGTEPLSTVVVQLTSQMQWESVRVGGAAVPLEQHLLLSDLDHTGALREASIRLSAPLAPGASIDVDAFASGLLRGSAERLLRMGAPDNAAQNAEWDTVQPDWIALRGRGNSQWLPAISEAALLHEGAKFSAALDRLAEQERAQAVHLHLVVESEAALAPQAWFCGQPVQLSGPAAERPSGSAAERPPGTAVERRSGPASVQLSGPAAERPSSSSSPSADEVAPRVSVADWTVARRDGCAASLLLPPPATPAAVGNGALQMAALPGTASAYLESARRVQVLLGEWLGTQPARKVNGVQLPLGWFAPFSDGSLLVIPQGVPNSSELDEPLAFALAAAWLPESAPAWLRDGLPEWMRLLTVERQAGRDALLATLSAHGDQLAAREAFAPVALATCNDAACTRSKAAYVLLQLRTLAGEPALRQAISAWVQRSRTTPARATTAEFESLLQQASGKDLRWFFADWIDHDPGLPRLEIVSVAPREVTRADRSGYLPDTRKPVLGPIGPEPTPLPGDPGRERASAGGVPPREGSWLVLVDVRNDGGAAAEVPVTVRNGSLVNSLPLRIPAHGHATIRVPFEAEPAEVLVNDGTVPEVQTSVHRFRIAP